MNPVPVVKQPDLWICANCDLWWSCEPGAEAQTWRLFKLSNAVQPAQEHPSSAPAWKVTGPDPSVCPECGHRMTEHSGN